MPGNLVFGHFLEISSLLFSDFFYKVCVLAMSKRWRLIFGRKCRKYAGNCRFFRFSSDFFTNISLLFLSKTPSSSLVQLSTKLIFGAGTFQKLPEQPIFVGKTVFLKFLELYLIFFHEILHTDAKRQCLKCDPARFSKNLFFRLKMPEICRKIWFLGIFSRLHH